MFYLGATESGMSAIQLLKAGGGTMIVLALISVAGLAFIIYFFLYYREERLVPAAASRDIIEKLAGRRFSAVRDLSSGQDHIISRTVSATSFRVIGRDVGNLTGDIQQTSFNFVAMGAP